MLEGLDRVDWKKARHAYGSAADVPALLRALASEDPDVSRQALHRLYGNIFHQGGRFEAAALAVPFLFELVLEPATHDRDDLVFFLVSLAFGYESEVAPFGASPADDPERWGAQERVVYDAVAERVTSLVPLLREDEPLRLATAYALAHFPKQAMAAVADVRRAYDAGGDETTRATLLIALALLARPGAQKEEVVSFFRHVHGSDGSATIRATAAGGLALLGVTDDDVVQTICAAVINGVGGSTRVPWNDGDLDGYLALVLPSAARGREAAVAETLIDGLAQAQKLESKMAITDALLGVAAPSGDYRALSELQRRALRAIEEHGLWQMNGGVCVNFRLMSSELPSEQEDFRSFVQAAEASARGETVDWKPRVRPRPAAQRDYAPLAATFGLVFGIPLLLWLVFIVLDRQFLPGTLSGWALLASAAIGFGVSMVIARRMSRPARHRNAALSQQLRDGR